jgi:hypothetical protein
MNTNVHCVAGARAFVAKESKGFRLDLGEPLASKLADFCAAHYDGTQTKVIRDALEKFLEERLADPEEAAMRRRYEEIRRKRLAVSGLQPPD